MTDADKWNSKWFRELSVKHKILWLYMNDNCDHAGVWEVDLKAASYMIGSPFKKEEVLTAFGDRVRVIDGERWWIVGFIWDQYKCGVDKLDPTNKAHLGVLRVVERWGLLRLLEAPIEGLSSPTGIGVGIEIGIGTGKEKEKSVEKVPATLDTPEFLAEWSDFQTHRTQIKKPMTDLAKEKALARLAKFPPSTAIAMLKQSIENGWQGIFELKAGQGKPPVKRIRRCENCGGDHQSFLCPRFDLPAPNPIVDGLVKKMGVG